MRPRPPGVTRSHQDSIDRRRVEAVGLGRGRAPTQRGVARALPWQPPTVVEAGDPQLWKKLTAVSAALFVATLVVAVALTAL